jgi:TonB family protein
MLALLLLMAATPIGSPGDWIRTEDYPAEVLNSGIEGTVDFSLSVTKDGNVGDCKIIKSSGSDILDKETCSLLTVRAQFEPAEVSSIYRSRVFWKIPPAPKMALETQGIYALTTIAQDGEPLDCINGEIGQPLDSPDLCGGLDDSDVVTNLLSDNKLKVAQMELRMFMKPAASSDPATASKGSDLIHFELVSANFKVDRDGFARECEVHATKFSPAGFDQICDSFDLQKPDFVAGDMLREPLLMQMKIELIVTPRTDVENAGAIQKN